MKCSRIVVFILSLSIHNSWAQSVRHLPGFDPNAVDKSVNPCQDFYQYACGNWLAANPLPADRARWGRFDAIGDNNREMVREILVDAASPRQSRTQIEQQVGDYYHSCVDTETLNKLGSSLIESVLRRMATLKNHEIPAELARTHRAGAIALFLPYSARDFDESDRFILTLDEGEIQLPREYYLLNDTNSKKMRREFLEHARRLLVLAGVPPHDARKEASQILDIDIRLATEMLSLTERQDPYQRSHKYTREELFKSYPHLKLEEYFRLLGKEDVAFAIVVNPKHLRIVNELVSKLPLQTLVTYLKWHWIREAAPFLGEPFIHEHDRFHQLVLGGQKSTLQREKQCTRFVEMDLSHPVGQLFIKRAFGPAQKQRVQRMSREIRMAMARQIETLPWMTTRIKCAALAKLEAITEKIGYPSQWRDYSGLRIVRGDALGNSLRANEFELMHQLRRISQNESDEWLMAASVANAYYYNSANEIVFPAGILQPPFYDHELDDAVNYGTLGTVIGHEITHGFDTAGRSFDAEGKLRNWWEPTAASAFGERAACFAKQYSEYTVDGGVRVNGELTLSENIADHGGMRIALQAFLNVLESDAPRIDGYSPLQRFFLAHAQTYCANISPAEARRRALTDTHAPNQWRVNGVVFSFPEFATTFQCSADSEVVRSARCRVW
jgi:putative endopeptidase